MTTLVVGWRPGDDSGCGGLGCSMALVAALTVLALIFAWILVLRILAPEVVLMVQVNLIAPAVCVAPAAHGKLIV